MNDDSSSVSNTNLGSQLTKTMISDLPVSGEPSVDSLLHEGDLLLDRYEIREKIGQGGMGSVYSAFDRNRKNEIAIKLLNPGLWSSPQAKNLFLNEGIVSTKLSHESIVNVFDIQIDNDLVFITMERLQGQTLREYLVKNRNISIDFFYKLADSLCRALTTAHKHVIHKDIKPENIFVCDSGDIKLMDFGISSLITDKSTNASTSATGSAYYMAPEVVQQSEKINEKADQYSLAIVAYEVLSGKLPVGKMVPLHTINSKVPKHISIALDKALDAIPDSRFESIEAFNKALQTPDKKKSPQASIIIAAAVVIIGIGLAFTVKKDPQPINGISSHSQNDTDGPLEHQSIIDLHKETQSALDGYLELQKLNPVIKGKGNEAKDLFEEADTHFQAKKYSEAQTALTKANKFITDSIEEFYKLIQIEAERNLNLISNKMELVTSEGSKLEKAIKEKGLIVKESQKLLESTIRELKLLEKDLESAKDKKHLAIDKYNEGKVKDKKDLLQLEFSAQNDSDDLNLQLEKLISRKKFLQQEFQAAQNKEVTISEQVSTGGGSGGSDMQDFSSAMNQVGGLFNQLEGGSGNPLSFLGSLGSLGSSGGSSPSYENITKTVIKPDKNEMRRIQQEIDQLEIEKKKISKMINSTQFVSSNKTQQLSNLQVLKDNSFKEKMLNADQKIAQVLAKIDKQVELQAQVQNTLNADKIELKKFEDLHKTFINNVIGSDTWTKIKSKTTLAKELLERKEFKYVLAELEGLDDELSTFKNWAEASEFCLYKAPELISEVQQNDQIIFAIVKELNQDQQKSYQAKIQEYKGNFEKAISLFRQGNSHEAQILIQDIYSSYKNLLPNIKQLYLQNCQSTTHIDKLWNSPQHVQHIFELYGNDSNAQRILNNLLEKKTLTLYNKPGLSSGNNESLLWLKFASEMGLSRPIAILAHHHYTGDKLPYNLEASNSLVEDALRTKDLYAKFLAYKLSSFGLNDRKLAVTTTLDSLLLNLKNQSTSEAPYLDNAYAWTLFFKKDYEEAIKWFEKAAYKNESDALFTLGKLYQSGGLPGLNKNLDKAQELMSKAAGLGNVHALNSLAKTALAKNNFEEAKNLFEQAAIKGLPSAQNQIATMYEQGKGTEKSYDKSLYWYTKAADHNIATAQESLGRLYYNGQGAGKSFKKALYWFQLAAQQGRVDSQYYSALLLEKVFLKVDKALELYKAAADKGHPKARLSYNRLK